jgi:DNA-binding MarR family transcriptional regulator
MYPKEYFSKLFNLNRDIGQIFFREFETIYNLPDSLNHTHMKTLMFLRFNGPSPMSHISTQLSLEKGSFTSVAHRLIETGYIEKQRAEGDKRIFLLNLTDKGKDFSIAFGDKHLEYVKNTIGVLDDCEQMNYLEMVDVLLKLNTKIRNKLGIDLQCK